MRALAEARWNERSPREQLLLGGLAALAVAVLLVNAVWRPLQTSRAAAVESIRVSQAVSAQLRVADPQALMRVAGAGGAPATVITDSAAAAGVSIRQLQPEGAGARLTFEDVEFTRLLAFLTQVERDGSLRARDLKLERRPAPGVVNAQLLLGR